MSDSADNQAQPPAYPTPPEEREDLAELRAVIHPEQTLNSLDAFSAWMFTAAVVVGSLGGAFGVSGFGPLDGTGKKVFGASVVCLALSLAFAAAARVPYRVVVNRWSLKSLSEGFEKIVKFRSRALIAAAAFFVVALILAGVAPLFS